MRNTKLLPLKPLLLLFGALLIVLFLTTIFSPESTFATDTEPDDSAGAKRNSIDDTDAPTVANCRYGASASPNEAHVLSTIGAGAFYDWRYDWPYPMPANNAEFLHMIRPRQAKTKSGEYLPDWYTNVPLNEKLADEIRRDPGAIWMIGNEPERGPNPGETYSARTDDIHAEIYAEAYHDIYHFIKGIDPTARIANAGLIQITPMRLQYLDMMWDAYEQKYGTSMPVDVWTIHAYVMPELTPDGQPNTIASAALGTDLALGKRGSGNDKDQCSDPDVYCLAEHDDLSLLEEQIISMRQWMKARDQQDKPLIVTEYSTLYHYIVNNDGSCGGLRDEYGNCFTPQRVSKFMLDSFDMFNDLKDPALGMPADNNRLVQQWIWYDAHGWDIGSSNLLQNDKKYLTLMGKTFKNHVLAESRYVNLVVDKATAAVVEYDQNDMAKAKLTVHLRNNGNISIGKPFTVTFYKNSSLTQAIGSTTVTPDIRGCAARAYTAEVEWDGLSKGTYQFWVKLDRTNAIQEKSEADNVGSGQLEVTGPVYTLDVQIISDGEGVGGSVSMDPAGLVYPEGTVVTLTAVPSSGWSFDKWSGAVVGNSPQISVTMIDDIVLNAHFSQDQYQLTVDVSGNGEVSISPEKNFYVFGDKVTLKAIPTSEWQFVEWRGDIEGNTPQVEHTFDNDATVKAIFEKPAQKVYLPNILGNP